MFVDISCFEVRKVLEYQAKMVKHYLGRTWIKSEVGKGSMLGFTIVRFEGIGYLENIFEQDQS